jgi:hypothetical protein
MEMFVIARFPGSGDVICKRSKAIDFNIAHCVSVSSWHRPKERGAARRKSGGRRPTKFERPSTGEIGVGNNKPHKIELCPAAVLTLDRHVIRALSRSFRPRFLRCSTGRLIHELSLARYWFGSLLIFAVSKISISRPDASRP